MLIQRISQPSFTLLDAATLAQWLRIDTGTDLATLDLLLASATDWIEGYTGRVMSAANYTVTFDGCDRRLPLGVFPVNSIASVVVSHDDSTTQELTAGVDYRACLASPWPAVTILNTSQFISGYTVTLNAGFAQLSAVPAAIQHAAAVLVGAGYDSRTALDPQTLATVCNLLSRHKRVFL